MIRFWPFRRPRPGSTPEAKAAEETARESFVQARNDLADQVYGVRESREVVAKLQAHNATNHFDEWLMDLAIRRAR